MKQKSNENTSSNSSSSSFIVDSSHEGCGIVDLVCDCYTGGRSSIPTHGDSLGK